MNRAKLPWRVISESASPHDAILIFYEWEDNFFRQLRIQSELATAPTGKPFPGADPNRPIARHKQALYLIAGEMLIRRVLPRDGSDTIEAKQAKFRAQPEITVGRLGNGVDDVLGKAVAAVPRLVGVLVDIEGWVQG